MAHVNPSSPQRTACAPYNFIPLPERVVKAVESAVELPDHNRFDTNEYPNSGYIDIELTTESPLYIRGPLNRREKTFDLEGKYRDGNGNINDANPEYKRLAKNKPDFFYIDPATKKPVIPGSELRGMIESVFEIITYSKFTRFDDRQIIYRDVAGDNSLAISYREKLLGENQASGNGMMFDYPHAGVKGGYLALLPNGDWAIQPAMCNVSTCNESFVHVECAPSSPCVAPISIQPSARAWSTRNNPNLELNIAYRRDYQNGHSHPAPYVSAWLIKTRDVGRNKHMQCAIYEPDWNANPIEIPDRLMSLYRTDCEIPRNPNTATRDLIAEYNGGTTRDPMNRIIVPLFYLVDATGTLKYFGSTLMFRLPYDTTVRDCVPADLCREHDLDFAQAVFGFVTESSHSRRRQGDKDAAFSSRVRFTLGLLANDTPNWQVEQNAITPKILSTPKPTCFQHYLDQDHPNSSANLVHYDDADQMPLLRGTKRNWHHQGQWGNVEFALQRIQNSDPQMGNKQKTLMRPLRGGKDANGVHRGVKFSFHIFFHNLSDVELGAILWAIEPIGQPLPDGSHRRFGHKLGMGKPYGMGSVSLNISKCAVSDRLSRYSRLVGNDNQWHEPTNELTVEERMNLKIKFERNLLDKLDLDPDRELSQIKRIAMLLKMMELPGQGLIAVDVGQGASNQNRARNIRYMTIKISPAIQANQRNEYNGRPVLPDPTNWMSETERNWATLEPEPLPDVDIPTANLTVGTTGYVSDAEGNTSRQPEVNTVVSGDPGKKFPRFSEGNVIELSVSVAWKEKKGEQKRTRIYTAADGGIGYFEGNVPNMREGETVCIARVVAIESDKNRYKLKVVN